MINNYFEDLYDLLKNAEMTDTIGYVKFEIGIDEIIELILSINKNKLIFIGNGGSAAIASHSATDYLKNGNVRTLCFNEASLMSCMSNDFGYEQVFSKPIELLAEEGDVLFAISSSGQSENILNACEKAKEIGCTVITLSGFNNNNPLRYLGDYNIYIDSGQYGFVELCHQIILHMILDKMHS